LAKSHQLNQCHMFSAQTMFKTETVTSRACKVKISDLPNALVAAMSQYISETEFWQSYSVSNGIVNIKCNFTYPLRFTDLELPLFFYCIQHFFITINLFISVESILKSAISIGSIGLMLDESLKSMRFCLALKPPLMMFFSTATKSWFMK